MKRSLQLLGCVFVGAGCAAAGLVAAQGAGIRGWQRGKGWGWIWGESDEVGALNALTDATRLEALSLVKLGSVYDLGVPYDRTSFKWPGHNPGEVITFRSPEGVKRQGDVQGVATDPSGTGWHSCALFISDNVGTQIDGLGHATVGNDNHWYNGFTEAKHGGDFGIRKCDGDSIPPIVASAVLIDVAGWKGVPHLPPHHVITAEELQKALAWAGVDVRPGDAVLIRTGSLSKWGESGADHATLKELDTPGIDLPAARWLVEEKGAVFIGSDTSGLEVAPPAPEARSFMPVHLYLLIEQGVHIGELHNLEALARDRVYRFCYVATVNRVRGAASGFTLRPLGLR